jgi:hypothetical protein
MDDDHDDGEKVRKNNGVGGGVVEDENIWWEWEMGRWGLFFELGQDTTI